MAMADEIDALKKKELIFLLCCLADAESRESRQIVLERLLPLLPTGHHPLQFIEQIEDPATRHLLRQGHAGYLNEIKLRIDIKRLVKSNAKFNLEEGVFLISRLSNDTEITPAQFKSSLDELAQPLAEKNLPERGREGLMIFLDYIFHELSFRGNTENYYDPVNSFLTRVLYTRQGIPVSLGVLCILLARRLGLKLSGVNMPGHFLLRFQDKDELLFIDPFNAGELLTETECQHFLEKQMLRPLPAYLAAVPDLMIIKRMYRNLINYYSSTGDKGREKTLRQHFAILDAPSLRP